jgi:hypothetical protein
MADITDQHDQTSPNELDETHNVGNGNAPVNDTRGVKRARTNDDDDDDDEKGGRERRKIEIKFISDKSRRHITFSKRKAGIMKKVCLFGALHHRFRHPSTLRVCLPRLVVSSPASSQLDRWCTTVARMHAAKKKSRVACRVVRQDNSVAVR